MASTTKILRLGSLVTSAAASLAAESLASGSVIAVPTDTIYGLACLVQHSAAVERLYTIKVRIAYFGNTKIKLNVSIVTDVSILSG